MKEDLAVVSNTGKEISCRSELSVGDAFDELEVETDTVAPAPVVVDPGTGTVEIEAAAASSSRDELGGCDAEVDGAILAKLEPTVEALLAGVVFGAPDAGIPVCKAPREVDWALPSRTEGIL